MKTTLASTTPTPSPLADTIDPSTARNEATETQRRRRSDFEANNTPGRAVDNTHGRTVDNTHAPPPTIPASPPPPSPASPAGEANANVRSEREAAASLPSRVAREQLSARPVAEPPAPDDGKRWRGQRMAAAARDVVEERIGPRVEKLRQASTVVLDEAADDPNLRFILIAVLLFIIAMVLILLSMYLR